MQYTEKNNISLPKTNVRRSKIKFTEKRDNYKRYTNAKWQWSEVFSYIEMMKANGEYNYIKTTSQKYNIKQSTLKNKYNKWIKSGKCNIDSIENRGGSNKSFTEEEERNLYEYIRDLYIKNDLFIDDTCLKIMAIKKWNHLHPNSTEKFDASNGWIYYFKKRWDLSSYIARKTKKSIAINEESVNEFIKECQEIAKECPKSLIFNMDETFWRLLNGYLNVIGLTGSDNRNLLTNINEKEGFTACFIISAAGIFLKSIIIIKGKTNKVFDKLGLVDDSIIHRKYSPNGWISEDIMIFILNEIKKFAGDNKAVLILDRYSVHTLESVKEYAKTINIQLIYVPTGRTSQNQPLDVNINGPIKSIGRQIIKELYLMDPFMKPQLKDAVTSLIEAQKRITVDNVIKSFKRACLI